MIRVTETPDFVIYDDVLEKDQFELVWNAIQSENYVIPHISNWSKVWRITDGYCLGSKEYYVKNAPFGNYMDLMHFVFSNVSKLHENIIPPSDIILRSYLYPRKTKLNWHNDLGYTGAGIFYAHPYWASTWGGELMLARTPKDYPVTPPHLDHTSEDKFLNHYGLGTYIAAKPNRLVLTKAGVWHSINRVDDDAGDHCRSSVVAFFKEMQKEEETKE